MLYRRALSIAFASGVSLGRVHAATVNVAVGPNSTFTFNPSTVQIVIGDTVTWNLSSGVHNVTSDTGIFTSPSPLAVPFSFTFQNGGDFPYHCTFHGLPGGIGMSGTITVVKKDVTVTLTTSKTPTVYGEDATLTATVKPFTGFTGTPTGTVTFQDGTGPLCDLVGLTAGPPDTATATCSTVPLPPGGHTIFATYNGDSSFNTFSGASVGQVVNRGTTTTSLVSSAPNPVAFGQNVTFTATITIDSPGTGSPGGTVTMIDGASPTNVCTSAPVVSGSVSCSTTTLDPGGHSITAFYSGDTHVDGSNSLTIDQKVTPPPPQNFSARADSMSQISITWTASAGTASYNVYRQETISQQAFNFASPGQPPVQDVGQGLPPPGVLSPNKTYLYRAEAIGLSNSGTSPKSLLDLATTIIFSDPDLTGVVIKAEHINTLRQAVNAVRVAANLLPITNFSDDPVTNTTPIRRIHIIEIRNALDPALVALAFPPIPYTDPGITQNVTAIRAAHVSKPRVATQ